MRPHGTVTVLVIATTRVVATSSWYPQVQFREPATTGAGPPRTSNGVIRSVHPNGTCLVGFGDGSVRYGPNAIACCLYNNGGYFFGVLAIEHSSMLKSSAFQSSRPARQAGIANSNRQSNAANGGTTGVGAYTCQSLDSESSTGHPRMFFVRIVWHCPIRTGIKCQWRPS